MLLIHKDISHMPITELKNDSESVWVEVFANKTSHFVASWYQPPGRNLVELTSEIEMLRSQLEKIKGMHKGNKPPIDIDIEDLFTVEYYKPSNICSVALFLRQTYVKQQLLNLPDTPYTSGRVLHGVRVEMAKKKNKKKKKRSREGGDCNFPLQFIIYNLQLIITEHAT